jgi:hypothetical protein
VRNTPPRLAGSEFVSVYGSRNAGRAGRSGVCPEKIDTRSATAAAGGVDKDATG